MKKCKHETFKLNWISKDSSYDDEYGSYHSHTYYYLICTKCKKEILTGHDYQQNKPNGTDFKQLTGRDIELSDFQQILKYNPFLFENFEGYRELKKLALYNPKLEKQLKKKRKLIKKHITEYKNLLIRYKGGYLSVSDSVSLNME